MSISDAKIAELEKTAEHIRESIITMLAHAQSGHSAGPLGMTDIFTALYFHSLNIDPENPTDEKRDRVILSNGHICPVWYATLAARGFIKEEELLTLRALNSRLQGHPHRNSFPGIENTSGPLGQGMSVAVGIALAAQLKKARYETVVLCGDGELQEGQIWEALMFAGNYPLHNLTLIIDRNNIQIDGMTEHIQPLEPLADKLRSFNWHVIEINGHNMREIIDAIETARSVYERPVAIIAHTIPGKGVEFMEFDYTWHGKPPNDEEARKALSLLRTLKGTIQGEQE